MRRGVSEVRCVHPECTARASGWKRETDVGNVGVACEGERRGYVRSIKLPPVSPSSLQTRGVSDAARRGGESGGGEGRGGAAGLNVPPKSGPVTETEGTRDEREGEKKTERERKREKERNRGRERERKRIQGVV